MPRPGSAPSPQYQRGSGASQMPYGAAAAANRTSALDLTAPTDEETFTPQNPEEQFAFSPTDFPSEPLTSGVPFGPGNNGVALPTPTPEQTLGRVAARLAAQPGQSPEVRAFIAKVNKGL